MPNDASSPSSRLSGKIAVIILNFNNALDTIRCVESIHRFEREACDAIIVDNCSTDDSLELIEKNLNPNIYHLIASHSNNGYAAGNNQGIAYAASKGYPYICVLNNDTALIGNCLSRLAGYLEQDSDCSIVGPAICEYNRPDIVQSAGAAISLFTGIVKAIGAGKPFTTLPPIAYTCDYIGGACMMFRTSDLERLHYLPENYFLFFEETEWCFRASKEVGAVKCVPNLSILHKGSASIDKNNINKSDLLIKNNVVFERRNATYPEFALYSIRFFIITLGSLILHGPKALRRFKLFHEAARETRNCGGRKAWQRQGSIP